MLITAYRDHAQRRRADELGAADFLAEPVDFEQSKAQLCQLPSAAD
jgi:CheY-like chemotaxis protein